MFDILITNEAIIHGGVCSRKKSLEIVSSYIWIRFFKHRLLKGYHVANYLITISRNFSSHFLKGSKLKIPWMHNNEPNFDIKRRKLVFKFRRSTWKTFPFLYPFMSEPRRRWWSKAKFNWKCIIIQFFPFLPFSAEFVWCQKI